MSMESKPQGVSLSTAQAAPSLSTSSSGIRAPPTTDSDFEFSLSTNGQKTSISSGSSYVSDSGFDSEGFVSGEDEFETASERPFVADPDDETLEEVDYVEEYVVSRPYQIDPDEEITQLRPLVVERDEEPAVFDVGVLSPLKPFMPIALLSGDSDDDDVVSNEEEEDDDDDGVLGSVRVPGVGVLERINSAPKVKILEVEEGDEDESEFELPLEAEIDDDSISDNLVSEVLGSSGERIAVEDCVSKELVQDKGPDLWEEPKVESLVPSEDDVLSENSKIDEDAQHLFEKTEALKTMEQQQFELDERGVEERNWVDLGINAASSMDDIVVKVTEIECEGNVGIDIDDGSAVIEETSETVVSSLPQIEVDDTEAAEIFNFEAEVPVNNGNSETNAFEFSGSVILGRGSDNEKSKGSDEVKNDSGVRSYDSEAANGIESVDRAIVGKDIQSMDCTEKLEPYPNPETNYFENGHSPETVEDYEMEHGLQSKSNSVEPVSVNFSFDPEVEVEKEDEEDPDPDKSEEEEEEVSLSNIYEAEDSIFGFTDSSKQIIDSNDLSQSSNGRIVADSEEEEVETDEEHEGKEIFDSAALAALLKAATGGGSDGGSITLTSADGSRVFSLEHPAGANSLFRSLRSAPRPSPNIFTPEEDLSAEEKSKLEKLQLIRVKFLRLVQRLGRSPDDPIAAEVLYRLVLAAGRGLTQAFSLESAKRTAMELELEGKSDLDFSLNILMIGKTGVGKSATINSIFGEEKTVIDPFEPTTTSVKEINGTINGVKIRLLDTPGLRSSFMEQSFNRKILSSIKKFTKKCPPDIVLYVDRVDTQARDLNDLPLLRSITSSLGSSIWRNSIITLTHAGSTPPDGPSGLPLGYEVFVAQRSRVVQQLIGHAVGDLHMMNPSSRVSLVENHSNCQKNGDGENVLPNGESWRPQLLLLCYSMKILSEVNLAVKNQDPFDHSKLFGFRSRSPPLPYLLSSLLQSQAHPKLTSDQGGESVDSDIEVGELSDSDNEEDKDEYDNLPPFRPLRRSQIAKLSKEQRKAYFDEYDYRVKLLQKQQWREEVKRVREMKRKGKNGGNDYHIQTGEYEDEENGSPATIAVPLPDMGLPPSFDGDSHAYRYRFLEPTSQLLTRPVLDMNGWDHDCGYDGVSLEESLAIAKRFPAVISCQITKDKKDFNIHLDSSIAAKHGETGSTMAGFDIQTIGKQLAYILKGETKIKNFRINKTAAGLSVTFLGENVATGLKLEDHIVVGKRLILQGSAGAIRSQGDAACGANLEVRIREKNFPIGQDQITLGLSLMKWRGDLIWGTNLQSQFSVGRSSKVAVRAGLNNKLSGQISVKTSSSDQLQIVLLGLIPIAKAFYRNFFPQVSEKYSEY